MKRRHRSFINGQEKTSCFINKGSPNGTPSGEQESVTTQKEKRCKMESLIAAITKKGLVTVIDKTRGELIAKDKEFQKLEKKISDLEYLYSQLELDEKVKKTVEDYVQILDYTRASYGDLSYAAGVKDTILFLNSLGLLKAYE